MIPHEAVFRGLIALFDEYVETGNNVTHRDLVDFQRRLSSTSAIGMRMPYRWEKLDFTHLTSGKPETPAVLAQAALTTKNADVPVHDNAALQWFASSAFGAIGTLSCLLCVAGIFGAIFAGIGRVLFYLRTGEWLSSGCDVALKMNYDTNGWCSLQTQWAGFNDIMNTVTRHFDVSVMLFMIGVLALAVPLILLWLVTRR